MLSGRKLDILSPSPFDIEIEDIALGLSRVTRWNGQTTGKHPYSVAQHSMLVEKIFNLEYPNSNKKWNLAALLHDAPEYVIGDLITPFKYALNNSYRSVEDNLMKSIYIRFGLPAIIPKNIEIPTVPSSQNDNEFKSLKLKVHSMFKDHPGSLDHLWMPTNRKESLKWLDLFLENKFSKFGDYEDAIRSENNFLFHSALSPVLNMGLLTPNEVVNKALDFANKNSVPINSLEGFIRQIIGWREFIRGIYHYKGDEEIKSNYWRHDRKLTKDWYEGTTGITPLDDAIKDCLKFGYTHHIPRLMIICNIMNLSKIHPNEIYKWFMEMFVDSSDWVMVPNVYGMGTFADGGIFATKPYSCGSNYMIKMSNYKKDSWCDIVDGLYWKFMNDNISFFKSNPRLSILVGSLERMNSDRKTLIFDKANNFINEMTKK